MRGRRDCVPCRLCLDFGKNPPNEAEVVATVPMCGERPRYALCPSCLPELGEYVEVVEVLAHG